MDLELKTYFKIIKKRLWIIVSFVLIATVTTGMISHYLIQPIFVANSKVIVSKTSENQGLQSLDYNSVGINLMLINTYKEIISTPAITDKVVELYPDINMTSEELSEKIKVDSTSQTQVMTISIEDPSYNQAVKIVNAVAQVFKNQIPTIMKVDNVTILNEAKVMEDPKQTKPDTLINIAISLLVSLMVSMGLVFLLEYLDDSIKNEMDVEVYAGIPTLGVISKIRSKDMKSNTNSRQRIVGDITYANTNQ